MKFMAAVETMNSTVVPFDVRISSAAVKAFQVYVHSDISIEAYI